MEINNSNFGSDSSHALQSTAVLKPTMSLQAPYC
jgi:hypothetical protein